MRKERCFECKQFLSAGQARCSCGWQLPKKKTACANYDCQYQSKGRRCRLDGTMSHSTHANANWYCVYHYRSMGDPKQGEEMLQYIESNYQEIKTARIDWRRNLHLDKTKNIWSVHNENKSYEISVNF